MSRLGRAKFLLGFLWVPAAFAGNLETRIDKILRHQGMDRARTSLQIVHLADGAVLYERNADQTVIPASTAKLVTAAAALKLLGPDFTFRTEFYSQRPLREGRFQDLWIKGYGDPSLVTEELEALTRRFRLAGLEAIDGAVYVDDSYFDRDHLMTYLSDEEGKIYQIATGPLSFNFNTLEIRARPALQVGEPAVVELRPPTRYVTVINETQTVGRPAVRLEAELKNGVELRVWGKLRRRGREVILREGLQDPATYTGTVFLEGLQREGVFVKSTVIRGAVPPGSLMVFSHTSAPLKKILESVGKFSNNFTAEQIFKALGAIRFGPPGTQDKGRQVLQEYLFSLGIPEGSYSLENGSGLSKLSRLSASQLVRVLTDLDRSPWRDDLFSSLSIGGGDGTMKKKFRGPLQGRVIAKTGSLNQVDAVAGYLSTDRGPVAFALLFNDFGAAHQRVVRTEERILEEVLLELTTGRR